MRSSSTEAPSLPRHYPASSVIRTSPPPQKRPSLSLASCQLIPCCDHRRGYPCCACSPLPACRRQHPGRTNEACSLVLPHPLRTSHECWRVVSCVIRFEACSAFTSVAACTLARSPERPSTPNAPTASLPPPPLRLLPSGANQFPGGTCTRCGPAPFHGAQHCSTRGTDVNQIHSPLPATR